ncbi:aspartate/glutamate racemase family protein [Sphingomicrobium aestuariivivum]|uniref:aspartate/glutamate racemase family protein n=1 Tax=Sphingomicrobium aestuariivivum TaxID=1582356 RepID=UPI001FD6FEB3|nr:aspartate/glutamate racemase family protein [Sphingomicrobium aestuariivivum]MCJ8190468.1 aspartate/glutamate racemase family protein [Sphingomicrobium aestuariivivum]
MKTIGILGGMSAASTQGYYRLMCELAREKLGGLHSPELLIRSVDFATIEQMQMAGEWAALGGRLNAEARALESGGAELLLLATNTMHKVVEPMMAGVGVPLLHIADATAARIVAAGFARPGLMATRFTMEEHFYRARLEAAGLLPVIPSEADRAETHRIIYEELCRDEVRGESRAAYEAIAARLGEAGADCLILGCTEIGMLLGPDNSPLPVFDTTRIHCEAALEMALV